MRIFCDALRMEAIPACTPVPAAPVFFAATGPIAKATNAHAFGQGALFNQGMVRATSARARLVPAPQPEVRLDHQEDQLALQQQQLAQQQQQLQQQQQEIARQRQQLAGKTAEIGRASCRERV